MPKAETSLVDEILDLSSQGPKGGIKCWVCANVTQEHQRIVREARTKGAKYGAIHSALETNPRFGYGKGKVPFFSVKHHLLNGHDL